MKRSNFFDGPITSDSHARRLIVREIGWLKRLRKVESSLNPEQNVPVWILVNKDRSTDRLIKAMKFLRIKDKNGDFWPFPVENVFTHEVLFPQS